MNRRTIAVAAGASVLGVVGWLYLSQPACACLPPDVAARGLIKSEMRSAMYAQQAFLADSGRFARTLEEAGWVPSGSEVTLGISSHRDSAVVIEGTSTRHADVRCTFAFDATTEDLAGMTCTGPDSRN